MLRAPDALRLSVAHLARIMARRRRLDPKAIAQWRYGVIEEALAVRSREARAASIRDIERTPVSWPSGETHPVSKATAYRWLGCFDKDGLDGLHPATRKDKGKPKARIPKDVIDKAFALWADDSEITFTFLLALLQADPELQQRGLTVSRSTLQRRLAQDPRYARLKRAKKLERRRGRYVARRPHEIWHLDAKGPVSLRLTRGERIHFHVLTVLDDATRAVLASIVVDSPDLCAAVRVFRTAAKRWGLPDLIYADRASIFDSVAFRSGLAQLGTHRIRVRSRNPEANGKIEAFHRVLIAWFTGRLPRQKVVDVVHLQQLLDAVIETVYQDHRHRGLDCSPRKALADQTSQRQVSAQRLENAFREERRLKAHAKTGEVDILGGTYLVPDTLRGQKLTFLIDPEPEVPPLVVDPGTGQSLPLTRAKVRPSDRKDDPPAERWGQGPLQTLYDAWQGKVRPVAEPGFGLPEIFVLLAYATGRPVPRSDGEAALIQRSYQAMGPLPKKATEAAFGAIRRELGSGRPIGAYLDALARRVLGPSSTAPKKAQRKRKR